MKWTERKSLARLCASSSHGAKGTISEAEDEEEEEEAAAVGEAMMVDTEAVVVVVKIGITGADGGISEIVTVVAGAEDIVMIKVSSMNLMFLLSRIHRHKESDLRFIFDEELSLL